MIKRKNKFIHNTIILTTVLCTLISMTSVHALSVERNIKNKSNATEKKQSNRIILPLDQRIIQSGIAGGDNFMYSGSVSIEEQDKQTLRLIITEGKVKPSEEEYYQKECEEKGLDYNSLKAQGDLYKINHPEIFEPLKLEEKCRIVGSIVRGNMNDSTEGWYKKECLNYDFNLDDLKNQADKVILAYPDINQENISDYMVQKYYGVKSEVIEQEKQKKRINESEALIYNIIIDSDYQRDEASKKYRKALQAVAARYELNWSELEAKAQEIIDFHKEIPRSKITGYMVKDYLDEIPDSTINPVTDTTDYKSTNYSWEKDNKGNWYFYKDGYNRYANGWLKIDGKWHYFYPNAVMARNKEIDGNLVGENGVWVKRWPTTETDTTTMPYIPEFDYPEMNYSWQRNSRGDWFYSEDGSNWFNKGWLQIGGKWYYFYDNGVMARDTKIGAYFVNYKGELC